MSEDSRDITGAKPSWTLGTMAFQLQPAFESYVIAHSAGYGSSGTALVRETEALGDPAVMMLAKEEYALLRFLAGVARCRRALDVGTFTGLSALALADGVGPRGSVVTIDRDTKWLAIAQRHWESAGVAARIEVMTMEADAAFERLARGATQPFDIAFLDVDKARVAEYFEATLSLLANDGLIVVDNTFWHGWVLDADHDDPDTRGMRRFNDQIAADPSLEVALLPIGDGLTLVRRK